MKIEDIKPGDVIVRTEDKAFFKIAEVTPDRKIMQSANGRMNEVFCIFLEPEILVYFAEDDYEPATEDQRQYVDSKLADFYGTNAEAASKRLIDLAAMTGDLKQINVELTERVEQLMRDYDKLVKQLQATPLRSQLTEAVDTVAQLYRLCNLFKKKYEHRQLLCESLYRQCTEQIKELEVVREERDAAKEQYNDLQQKHEELRQQYDAAKVDELQKSSEKLKEAYDDYRDLREDYDTSNSRLARFENAEFEHADFSTMAFDCPHGVEAKVCSAECLGCEHCLTQGNTGTEIILCAYNYDKKKEKEQYLDKLRRQMIRNLNS